MTRSPAEPWTRLSPSPRRPAVGLTPRWTPGTGALLPYAAARPQVNTVVHLGERKETEINKRGCWWSVAQTNMLDLQHRTKKPVYIFFYVFT